MDLTIYDFAVAAIQQAVTNVYEFSSKFSIGSDTPGSATIVLVRFCFHFSRILQPSMKFFVFSSGFLLRDVDTR